MTDWYVSATNYLALTPFQVNHAYNLGDFTRQRGTQTTLALSSLTETSTTVTANTASPHGFVIGQSVLVAGCTPVGYNGQVQITGVPTGSSFTYTAGAGLTSPATVAGTVFDFVTQINARVFRCSTPGTSNTTTEPTWVIASSGATTTSGTAVFTECTGKGTGSSFWTTASYTVPVVLQTAGGFAQNGDRVFVASNHAETWTISVTIGGSSSGNNKLPIKVVSVNRAGSTPPVAADITPGASVTVTGNAITGTFGGDIYWEGLSFTQGGASPVAFNLGGTSGEQYYKNCAWAMNSSVSSSLDPAASNSNVIWDNCTLQFGSTGNVFGSASQGGAFTWKNTAAAIQGGTLPTNFLSTLFGGTLYFRGVDLSALTGNIVPVQGGSDFRISFANCKFNASATLVANVMNAAEDTIEFVNCDSGATQYKSSWYRYPGNVQTDTQYIRSGGATDGVQAVSHRYVSNPTANAQSASPTFPLNGPDYFAWQATVGAPVTSTIEVLSALGVPLNNDDLWVELEYLGSASAPLSSFINDTIATVLSADAAQPTSTHTFADWGATGFNPYSNTNSTLSGTGNVTVTKINASAGGSPTICYFGSGTKVYFEFTLNTVPSGSNHGIGFSNNSFGYSSGQLLWSTLNSLGYLAFNGKVQINSVVLATLPTATTGDVLGFAVDLVNNNLWIRKNGGNWNNSGLANPSTNTGGISISTINAGPYNVGFVDSANASSVTVNIGGTAFGTAAPVGFTAPVLGNTQKLQVTFTPRLAGLLRATVKLGNNGGVAWVDPLLSTA